MEKQQDPYQVMPELSAEEYAALRADIKANGVLQPIDADSDGNVLDGHNRKAIADELGIECPIRTVGRLADDDAKRAYALTVNIQRRQLTVQARTELIEKLHAAGWTVRKITGATGIPKSTVGRAVSHLGHKQDGGTAQAKASPRVQAARKREARKREENRAALAALNEAIRTRAAETATAAAPSTDTAPVPEASEPGAQGRDEDKLSRTARDLLTYIESALDGARRIRLWQQDHQLTPGEAAAIFGTDKATEMFDAVLVLGGASAGQKTWDNARQGARRMLGIA